LGLFDVCGRAAHYTLGDSDPDAYVYLVEMDNPNRDKARFWMKGPLKGVGFGMDAEDNVNGRMCSGSSSIDNKEVRKAAKSCDSLLKPYFDQARLEVNSGKQYEKTDLTIALKNVKSKVDYFGSPKEKACLLYYRWPTPTQSGDLIQEAQEKATQLKKMPNKLGGIAGIGVKNAKELSSRTDSELKAIGQ
jgi:hypothetical protein